MSNIYPWHQLFHDLHSQIHPELNYPDLDYHDPLFSRFRKAVENGKLDLYTEAKSLISNPIQNLSANMYLYPVAVNKWFEANDLPYRWFPRKKIKKRETLEDLKPMLKQHAVAAAQTIQAKGLSPDRTKVARELLTKAPWNQYSLTTLEKYLRVNWWQ